MASEAQPAASAWRIRSFEPADAEAISGILRDSPEAAQWPPASYAKLAEAPGGLLLVCESAPNHHPVAFLAARHVAGEAEILNIAVQTRSRHQGIASALLQAALDEFRRAAVTCVFLEFRQSNSPARKLYERHGFLPCGLRKSYYQHPFEHAVCMQKTLGTSA